MPKTLMLILLLLAVSAAPAWSQDDPGDEVNEMQSGDESEAFAEEAGDEPIESADTEDSGEDVIESEGDDAFADGEADSDDASEDQSAAGDEAADETAQSDEEEEAEDSADDEDAGASGDAAAATTDSQAQATDGDSANMNPQGSDPPPPPPAPPPPAAPPAPVAMADQKRSALDKSHYAFSAAIRWGDFEGAWTMVKPSVRKEKPMSAEDFSRYEQIQVTGYRDVAAMPGPDPDTELREIQIELVNRNTLTTRKVRFTESWHYDAEAKTWWIARLPDFWDGR